MLEQFETLIEEKNYVALKTQLNDMHPQDIALLLDEVAGNDEREALILFRLLTKENAAEAFVEASSDTQEYLINAFSDAELKSVFDEMFLDDTVDIIEEMPATVVKRIINQSDSETRKLINQILKYPKDSAGSVMTVEYISLKKQWTVRQCFDCIRKQALDKETIYNCYVTDETRKLIGVVSVKTLLLNNYDTVIENIMETDVISADTYADQEYVASLLSKYDLTAVPIVDQENRIVGIITIDDAIDVIEEEATEDIAKMAAIRPSDKPYLEQSVWQIWLNRVPWLLVLMVSATFTGLIINTYESKLAAISTVLFACVPMLMDTGGNAGSQASVTVIRSLAIGDLVPRDVFKVLWKELRVSILLGLVLAIACFAKLQLIDRLLFRFEGYDVITSAVVSLALFITIVLAKFVGAILPLFAKKIKLDPAVVASPFITTIVDALSLIIYCTISIAILS
ncbi:MAG: magnesium transporter [Clostridia bacterium]|nr:magnesium transporter [Clostridia bacterium]